LGSGIIGSFAEFNTHTSLHARSWISRAIMNARFPVSSATLSGRFIQTQIEVLGYFKYWTAFKPNSLIVHCSLLIALSPLLFAACSLFNLFPPLP
jgi:hypothetical protein